MLACVPLADCRRVVRRICMAHCQYLERPQPASLACTVTCHEKCAPWPMACASRRAVRARVLSRPRPSRARNRRRRHQERGRCAVCRTEGQQSRRLAEWKRRREQGTRCQPVWAAGGGADNARVALRQWGDELTHGRRCSEVGLSAEITTTRRHRPARIQSVASEMAAVVPAHAALMCKLGPRACARQKRLGCSWYKDCGAAALLHDFCELRVGHHENFEQELSIELVPADFPSRCGVACHLQLLLQPLQLRRRRLRL